MKLLCTYKIIYDSQVLYTTLRIMYPILLSNEEKRFITDGIDVGNCVTYVYYKSYAIYLLPTIVAKYVTPKNTVKYVNCIQLIPSIDFFEKYVTCQMSNLFCIISGECQV